MMFLLCLILKPYELSTRFAPDSWELLLTGWMGYLIGWFYWTANPLFLLSLLCWKKPKLAFWLSFSSFIFAASFFFQDKVIMNEGGNADSITSFGPGLYLWCIAIFNLVLISAVRAFKYTKLGQ